MPIYDNELCEGQMSISDFDRDFVDGKYALSNDFVRMPKNINIQPLKVLGLILSKIDYRKDNRDNNGYIIIECTLSEIKKACGVSKKDKNYEYYKNIVEELIKSSFVKGNINGMDIMGYAVPKVTSIPDAPQIAFNFKIDNDFLPYFQQLKYLYTIVELEEIKLFKSRFSYNLYVNLISWKDSNNVEFYRYYTTKQLKELFGLAKEDYCKKDGKFNRSEFEKKTVDVAIREINKNTKLKVSYKKNKVNGLVKNYQFNFIEYEI